MGSLERRLQRLEGRMETGVSGQDAQRVSREVLRLMTTEELEEYEKVLERAIARGEPVRALPEDEPTVRRVWEIYEEVKDRAVS